jgi:putative ABC transport system permease protein
VLAGLWQDVRYSARMLLKKPGFLLVTVLSLGLGFALVATVMAVVNAYLIRSMPYPAANRLHRLIYAPRGVPYPAGLHLIDWKALGDVVEIADRSRATLSAITDEGYTQEVMGLMASPGSLEALGVRAIVGRSLLEDDFRPGAERVALIGHALWRERFGDDPNVVGRVFRLHRITQDGPNESFRIVGVLPPDFRYVLVYARGPIDFVAPIQEPTEAYMVRLRVGVPVSFAERRITEAVRGVASSIPPNWSGVRLESVQAEYVAELRPMLFAITVAAGLVLIIVCLNVAILALLRALRRQKEMAVRVALGAKRGHIVRMLMIEAGMICVAAMVGSFTLTSFALQLLAPVIEERLGRPVPGGASALALDVRVLLVVGGVGVVIALALAFIPLLTPWKRRLADTLRRGGRSGADCPGMRRLRSALIALEVGLSLALLVGCGLMIRSVANLVRTDLGFRTEQIVRARFALPPRTYPDGAALPRFYERLTEKLSTLSDAPYTLGNLIPFFEGPKQQLEVDGQSNGVRAGVFAVDNNHFATLGVAIKQGRGFIAHDRTEPVAIISESLARQLQLSGNNSVIGRHIRINEPPGSNSPPAVWRTIVGVASDMRQTHYDVDFKDIYIPFFQAPSRYAQLYLLTDRPPSFWAERLRAMVAEIDPEVSFTTPTLLVSSANKEISGPKFLMSLLTGFALFATLLALLGIYGVTAYGVQQREREIAIRVALGATPRAIQYMFLREGGRVLAIGIVNGLLGAAAVARMLTAQLYGVHPFDAATLCGACVFLALMGLLATWRPARRAAQQNPISSLNEN